MPVLAFTFGSFGDIATILQLAWTIRRTLSESAGSLAPLIADIDVFTRALQQINSFLETRAAAPVPEDLMNGIAHALERCFGSLMRIKQRIESFNAQLAGAVGKSVVREYWAVLGWEILGGRREVEALKMRLSDQIVVIQTLLAASQCRNLEGIKTVAKAHSQSLDDIRNGSQAAHRHVRDMFASMRELCIRLSATSAAFAFFDSSGAQVLPIAVMPLSLAKKLQLFNPHRPLPSRPWRFKTHIRAGRVYFWLSISLIRSARGHQTWLHYQNTSVLGTHVVNRSRPYLEISCFLHCKPGEGVRLRDVLVFISPVYGKIVPSKADRLRSGPIPAASALISGLVRTEREVTYDWILDDLVHEMGGTVNTMRYRKLRRPAAV
ncbi:hypothetical protein EXIGLDRAFT_753870 [Exidia glandulosa HHB12029]|uniref:Fungal N-terminal domain-containing protein n=1 Tax=Exidia glandulosa HHB12029 TaxID=1314781 RepID=A0A165DEV6_EXIGL|nr:hypothetical protein EXIGLDRAFT_753870 [Exidia glandulosa HHB12029]